MALGKKQILFIVPLPPPVHGSAMVSQFVKDSKLVQGEFDCDFVNLSISRKTDEIGKRSVKKFCRFMSSYFAVFFKLLTCRYDLCYLAITCYGWGFIKDAPFVLLCKLFGYKVVIHQHNKGMSNCVDKWPYRWLLPLVYKNTKVILLSWHLYPDIESVVKRDQVLICPNGIPEIPELSNVMRRNNAVPQLLFLSNLIPSKGVFVLLDACKSLKEKGMQFVCNYVGGESKDISRQIFENEVRKRKLDGVVNYLGPMYGKDKHAYWASSDIFVFPTYCETFGLVNLEAMQYKLPIVTTNEGGIPDVVKDGDNGFVCERKDPVSLAIALEKLLINASLRQEMGNRGYVLYKEKFTLSVFEQRLVDVIRLCVNA